MRLQNEHALERAITQIGEEIHGQYLLSYTPAQDSETGFHRIRVVIEARRRRSAHPSRLLAQLRPSNHGVQTKK